MDLGTSQKPIICIPFGVAGAHRDENILILAGLKAQFLQLQQQPVSKHIKLQGLGCNAAVL